jgi:hypothetical protein
VGEFDAQPPPEEDGPWAKGWEERSAGVHRLLGPVPPDGRPLSGGHPLDHEGPFSNTPSARLNRAAVEAGMRSLDQFLRAARLSAGARFIADPASFSGPNWLLTTPFAIPHYTGRCSCGGEGSCEWCLQICPVCLGDCYETPCGACDDTGWRPDGSYPHPDYEALGYPETEVFETDLPRVATVAEYFYGTLDLLAFEKRYWDTDKKNDDDTDKG